MGNFDFVYFFKMLKIWIFLNGSKKCIIKNYCDFFWKMMLLFYMNVLFKNRGRELRKNLGS